MNINFEYYKIFYVVAKNKNITKGAEELNITQPAISRVIKALEDQIGYKLFIREKKGVILTREGEKLFNTINSSISKLIEADNEIKYDKKNLFKINIDTTILNNWLIPAYKNNNYSFDNYKFSNIFDPIRINNMLENNDIDCAIISENNYYKFDDNIEQLKIHFTIGLFKNKSNQNNTIILPDAKHILTTLINDTIEKNDITYNKTIFINDFSSIDYLISNGFGKGFLIKELSKYNENIQEIKLNNNPEINFYLLYKKDMQENNNIKILINLIKNTIDK